MKKGKWRQKNNRVLAVLLCLVILAGVIGPYHAKAAKQSRYIVLIVDTSDGSDFYDASRENLLYSAVSPMDEVKKAAINFAESLSQVERTSVAVVSYGYYAKLDLSFTEDITTVKSKINNISHIGGRKNMEAALAMACSALADIKDSAAKKTVILVSPGLTDVGEFTYSGHWVSNLDGGFEGGSWINLDTNIPFYAYSNSAYIKAEEIKAQGAKIYTIGVTKVMENSPDSVNAPKIFFEAVLRDIASEGCYFEVDDAENFCFVFEQMGKEIILGSSGTFHFSASGTQNDGTATFYFENSYFDNPATEYNPSLATMSLCLAMSAFGASGAVMNDSEQPTFDQNRGKYVWSDGTTNTDANRKNQWSNAYELLNAIGFDTIETNKDFQTEPETDSMGVIVGMKKMETDEGEYTLIALATRGGGYYSEWSGNFNIGRSGNHAGFTLAKNEAKLFLDAFVTEHIDKIEGSVKLWMAGYSRGGATVNLLAGEVTERGTIGQKGEVSVSQQSIYAYCFEPPRGLDANACSRQKAESFHNIFNIVNPNDPVPLVAMEGWGFIRYGVTKTLPASRYTSAYNNAAAKMMNYYRALDAGGLGETHIDSEEYESQYDSLLEDFEEYCRSKYSDACVEMSYYGQIQDSFENFWPKIMEAVFKGEQYYCDIPLCLIDMAESNGYGVFSNLYEYANGMIGIRNHSVQNGTPYSNPNYGKTYISLVDLYHQYDIRDTVLDIKGIWHLKEGNYSIQYLNADLSSVLPKTLLDLTKSLSRKSYETYVEDWLCRLVELLMQKNSLSDQIVGNANTNGLLKDLFKELLRKRFAGDPIAAILNSSIMPLELGAMCVSLLVFEYSDYTVEQLYNLLLHELQDVLKKHGINIQNLETYFTENEKYYIKLGLKELVQALTDIAATRTGTNNLFSLAMNGSKLGMAHYPELCLAWLQSQDPNYNGNNEQIYVPSKERLIRINCPVDISVFDSQGVLVAEIIDNCPQAVDGSSIPCAYTENGEKTITLPMDEAYHLVTKASDDGIMDISINLFDLNGNCVYIENYYDITLIKDHSVTIDLPRSFFVDENGIEYENTVCSTVINGSENITASVVLDEEQTEAAEYSIIVDNRNTNGGVILGGGEYLLGSYALVTAAEYEDCSFVGWFEGDTLVSTERDYRFCVTSNRHLTARFDGNTQYGRMGQFIALIEADEGGFVSGSSRITALDGFPFEIAAIPVEGYEFVGWETDGNCLIENPTSETTKLTLVDENVSVIAMFRQIEDIQHEIDYGDYEAIQEGVSITYATESAWTGGYNGSITIVNNTNRNLTDWKLLFDSEAKISGVWSAQLVDSTNDTYSVMGYNWNRTIAPGQSAKVSFTALGNKPMETGNYVFLIKKNKSNKGDIDCRFEKGTSWGNGCTGEIVITNNSQNAINGWKVEFIYEGQINDVWNGVLESYQGNKYIVCDAGYNAIIQPGCSVRIGVNLTYTGSNIEPADFTFIGR